MVVVVVVVVIVVVVVALVVVVVDVVVVVELVEVVVVVAVVVVVVVVVCLHSPSRSPATSWYCPEAHVPHSRSLVAVPLTTTHSSTPQVANTLHWSCPTRADHCSNVGSHFAHSRSAVSVG